MVFQNLVFTIAVLSSLTLYVTADVCLFFKTTNCTLVGNTAICGSNGVTYRNRCYYSKAHCTDKNIVVLHDGPCKTSFPAAATSPTTAPPTASAAPPIASTPPKKAGKLNTVLSRVVRFISTFFTCSGIKAEDCSRYGTHEECGTNAVTYKNRCYYSKAHCDDKTIHVAYYGACKAPTTTAPPTTTPRNVSPTTAQSTASVDFHSTKESTPSSANCISVKSLDCSSFSTEPICGTNGVTYRNGCDLVKAHCSDNSILQFHDGPCKTPLQTTMAPTTMAPTTAATTRMTLQTHNSKTSTLTGATSDPLSVICGTMNHVHCEADIEPLCGSDGSTYINSCEFRKEVCLKRDLTVKHTGFC